MFGDLHGSLLRCQLTNASWPDLLSGLLCCFTEVFEFSFNPIRSPNKVSSNLQIAALQRGHYLALAAQGSQGRPRLAAGMPKLFPSTPSPMPRSSFSRFSFFPNSSESALVLYDARYQKSNARCGAHSQFQSQSSRGPRCVCFRPFPSQQELHSLFAPSFSLGTRAANVNASRTSWPCVDLRSGLSPVVCAAWHFSSLSFT